MVYQLRQLSCACMYMKAPAYSTDLIPQGINAREFNRPFELGPQMFLFRMGAKELVLRRYLY